MNINGFEFTKEEIQKHIDSIVGIFTLGEIIDKIECGMYATSYAGSDKGRTIGVDKYGYLYQVNEVTEGDIENNNCVKLQHEFYLKKEKEDETPAKRWILFNSGFDVLEYQEDETNEN